MCMYSVCVYVSVLDKGDFYVSTIIMFKMAFLVDISYADINILISEEAEGGGRDKTLDRGKEGGG